jgi:hypothetical protein
MLEIGNKPRLGNFLSCNSNTVPTERGNTPASYTNYVPTKQKCGVDTGVLELFEETSCALTPFLLASFSQMKLLVLK